MFSVRFLLSISILKVYCKIINAVEMLKYRLAKLYVSIVLNNGIEYKASRIRPSLEHQVLESSYLTSLKNSIRFRMFLFKSAH